MQKMEKQFHLHCTPEDIGRYCILPGDPGRVPAVAALLEDAHPVAYNREFNLWTGTLLGEKVTACYPDGHLRGHRPGGEIRRHCGGHRFHPL